MLRTISSNISIITNFGCRNNCWYCIWKNHPLKDVHIPTDWGKVQEFIKGYDKVSISGGGDPLFQFWQNQDWWNTLFSFGIKVDIHTREKIKYVSFLRKVNKLVFSSDNLFQDIPYLSWANQYVKIRINTVAFLGLELENYIRYALTKKMQLSVKKLSGYDDQGLFERLKLEYPQVFFIEDKDYNKYYMPDNTIWENFRKP